MGISSNKLGYYENDNLGVNKTNQSKLDKKNITESSRRRNHSTDIKENPLLIKNINFQNESNTQENKINEENINKVQNNKIFKCLSYEKLAKIEQNKDSNPNEIYNNLYEGGKAHSSNIEINKQMITENETEEDIYKDMENDNSIEEGSDLNSNSNSQSNKELQIIDENMKSLFLNSSKPKKDNLNNSNSNNINEEKDKNRDKEKDKEKDKDKEKSFVSSSTSPETITEYELTYYTRSAQDIRNSYIQKLVSKALYLPNNKPKTHNSLIIFDWDDTLLPTTFLTQGGVFNENLVLTENDQKKIEKLENSALKLLNMAITKGDVYIITNAGLGWVEYSAEKFYPHFLEILSKIKIISARGECEKDYPGDSRKWKIQTFLGLKDKLNTKLVTNIICLGDSLFEIEAGRVLANSFKEAFVKTIKFKEGPKPEELNKQLILVANQFNSICAAVKNLTIRVEKKKKGK
jgi:hypothetical protein